MVTDGGLSIDEVRAMTLQDTRRIFRHWSRFPPVRRLVAMYMGFKPAEIADSSRHMTATEAQAFMAATQGGKLLE